MNICGEHQYPEKQVNEEDEYAEWGCGAESDGSGQLGRFFAAVDAAGNEKCLGRKGGGRKSVWAGKVVEGVSVWAEE